MVTSRGRIEIGIGAALLIVASLVTWDTVSSNAAINAEHTRLAAQVDCNKRLLQVLQKRSDARIVVDLSTMEAQSALTALLNDEIENGKLPAGDPHIVDARNAFRQAAENRANPDLWLPYPQCNSEY